jgi:hypothetical protein
VEVEMKTIVEEVCELTNKPCQFVSNEFTYRPFTEIKKENGIFKPISHGKKKCSVGQICNTAKIGTTPWVDQMNTCPVLWSKARYGPKPYNSSSK